MKLQKIFELQRTLDTRIETEHGLQKADLFDKKLLALLVEVGELANETRCFKFWSNKAASPRETILEEFVDGVHFILSLGIVLGFDDREEFSTHMQDSSTKDLTEKFLEVYQGINLLQESRLEENYWRLLASFFELGELLGFSNEEIYKAYLLKNEINHKRQDEGY